MRIYTLCVILISTLHIYISTVDSASPLSWVFLVFIFSPFLPYAWQEIYKLRFDSTGMSLEKIKSKVDLTMDEAVHKKHLDPNQIDDLFKSVELNDWMVLVMARMLMRQGLVCLVPDHGLGVSPSLTKLISLCRDKGLVTEQDSIALERLRNVTFYAEWWGGNPPSRSDWLWAIDNCKDIISNLFKRQGLA